MIGGMDRHEWTNEGFSLGLAPSGKHWAYTYNAPGIAGGYRLGGETGRREVEGFLCREILRLAEENASLRTALDGQRVKRVSDASRLTAAERARIRQELEAFAQEVGWDEAAFRPYLDRICPEEG